MGDMRRVWFWAPERHWYGLATLWPAHFGGDEYGRRTLLLGWTVTGRAIVAISRPGRLYSPDCWEHHDDLTGITVRASIYPYGGGNRDHGVQLSLLLDGSPVAVARVPQLAVRELGELIGASRRLVWHDPRDADDQFGPRSGWPAGRGVCRDRRDRAAVRPPLAWRARHPSRPMPLPLRSHHHPKGLI